MGEERKEEKSAFKIRKRNLLSFADEESESDDCELQPQIKKRKLMKDSERNAEDEKLRKELEKEWSNKQKNIKRDPSVETEKVENKSNEKSIVPSTKLIGKTKVDQKFMYDQVRVLYRSKWYKGGISVYDR